MKTFEVVEKDGSSSKVEAEMYRVRGEKLVFFVSGNSVYQYDKDTVEKVIEEAVGGETPIITKV
jgi:hypothetical protein